MNNQDTVVTVGALIVGAGAVAAHHASKGTMDTSFIALASSDTARGIAFGAGGGAAVGIVTRGSIADILGRTFVGGLMAATAAPWMAESVLHVGTNSPVYPVLCCSIGVLGFQMVKGIIDDPSRLPVIGKMLADMSGKGAATPPATVEAPPIPRQAPPVPAPTYSAPAVRVPLMR